jgi:ATP-dependent exoDNAse (exonuclease V) alpha subunit
VHPYGTIHIAQVLRNSLTEMHSLKLNHSQLEERSQQLMDFIKSDDFRNSVGNTIYRTQELAKILLDEHKEHMKIWQKRLQHYNGIHANTNQVNITTKNILQGVPVNKTLIQTAIRQLPAPDFR